MQIKKYSHILSLLIFFNSIHLTKAQVNPELVLPIGHTDRVNSAVFNATGTQIVTASNDGTARIWDALTGELLHTLEGHTKTVTSAVYNAEGTQIVTASADSKTRIWDASTGELLHTLEGHTEYAESAVYNATGSQIVTASGDNTARIWDAETGELLHTLEGHKGRVRVESAVFNAEGSQIVTASGDGIARIWDAQSSKLLHTLKGHTREVTSAVFNPTGSQIVTASWDGTARIWDAQSSELLHTLKGNPSVVESAEYNATGSQIVTASRDGARIWDAQSGELLHTLEGHKGWVTSAVYNAEGTQIVTASGDGIARIWDAQSGELLHTLKGHTEHVRSAEFNANGTQIVTASPDGTARIWDAETGEPLHTLEGHKERVNSAVYNPTGSQIVTASNDKTARIWDAETGELLHTLEGHKWLVTSAEFNNTGKQIVTMDLDYTARIWDAETGELIHVGSLEGHFDPQITAVFNSTGSQIVTASDDGYAMIFDTETLKRLLTLKGHTLNIRSAVFNATGSQIVTASKDKTARIWDAKTGELLHTLEGHKGWVNSAVYNPTGSQIVTASDDNTSMIWDTNTGELIRTLKGHYGSVESAIYDPSDNHIITTGDDHKTIIWDAHTGKQLYTRLQLKGGDWLAYDEHYRFEGSPGGIDQLYLVCGLEVIDLNQVKDSLYVPGLVTQIMSGAKEVMMNDRPAPKLEDLQICELTPVVEPIDQDKTNRIRYRIIPRKGGLGNVELYINNNLTYTYKTSDLKREPHTKNYILEVNTDTLQQYFTGDKGRKNPIMIKPLIKGGGIYGRGAGTTAVKTVDRKSPKFIGVFVGVNDYNNPAKDRNNPSYYTDLSYAEADAESMAAAMEQSARTLFNDSVLIYRVTQKSNKAPNKQELEKVFADISQKAKSEDILYVFFAGHGGIPKGAQNPNGEVRFMLHQASKYNPMSSSFGMSDIKEWIHPQKIKAQKRVLVFDACHSGQFIQDMNQYAFRGDKDEAWKKKQLDKLKDQTGMLILAASADDQSSYENDQLKHGVMTYHLLKQIKETQQDTTLILDDWFSQSSEGVIFYVDRKYPRSNNGKDAPVQTPQIFGRGDFGVGMVTQEVRDSIQLNKVKTLIGRIQFTDATSSILTKEPQFNEILHEQIRKQLDGNRFEFNPEADYEGLGYTITSGTMVWVNNLSINTYTIRYQGKDLKQVNIPQFTTKKPKEIAKKIAESIVKQIEGFD